jgi:hypothetical protein
MLNKECKAIEQAVEELKNETETNLKFIKKETTENRGDVELYSCICGVGIGWLVKNTSYKGSI